MLQNRCVYLSIYLPVYHIYVNVFVPRRYSRDGIGIPLMGSLAECRYLVI